MSIEGRIARLVEDEPAEVVFTYHDFPFVTLIMKGVIRDLQGSRVLEVRGKEMSAYITLLTKDGVFDHGDAEIMDARQP